MMIPQIILGQVFLGRRFGHEIVGATLARQGTIVVSESSVLQDEFCEEPSRGNACLTTESRRRKLGIAVGA